MDISGEPSIRSRVHDGHNPRIEDLHQILDKINKMLWDCREDFSSMHPRRPVEVAKVSAGEGPSPQQPECADIEYAEEVLNPNIGVLWGLELGTSLFYEED